MKQFTWQWFAVTNDEYVWNGDRSEYDIFTAHKTALKVYLSARIIEWMPHEKHVNLEVFTR